MSIFNWSIKKLLADIPSAFEKAKAKILFVILLISLCKIVVALAVAVLHGQVFQTARAIGFLFCYLLFIKLLLANKKFVKPVTHCMIITGLLLVWSNMLFVSTQGLTLITTQFICMLILSSFYLLNTRLALVYVSLSILPAIIYCTNGRIYPFGGEEQLASPGYEIIVIINFITIIISHYLFQQALRDNLKEKEELNVKLMKAVSDARQAAESRSDFLSTMSHELRTPLNSVIGITDLMLRDPHSNHQKENLEILKFSAGNLHTLINDILDFNKLGAGKLNLETIAVNLNELLQSVGAGLKFQAQKKGVDFHLQIDEKILDKMVVSDPTRLTQIIYNLAGNAIKFTTEGSVTVQLKVIDCNDSTVYIKIAVIDTGIGISEEQQKTIFEPFTQACSSITRNYGGTGLGLAIVKRLLYLFNSAIHLESTYGKGSVFSFELALTYSSIASASRNSNPLTIDLDGLRLLVADDNPMNRLLVKKIFSTCNCEVVFVEHGREAVEKLLEDNFDLILMDLHMPVLDGYSASKAIRNLPDPIKAGIPIIALTASVSGNLDEKIKEVGMNDYVLKPFKVEDLFAKIKSVAMKEL